MSGVCRSTVTNLGPTSVRDVAMLGSTTTATVCNTHTTGNIVIVAAGGNGTNGPRVAFSAGLSCSPGFSVSHLGLLDSRRGMGLRLSLLEDGCACHRGGKRITHVVSHCKLASTCGDKK